MLANLKVAIIPETCIVGTVLLFVQIQQVTLIIDQTIDTIVTSSSPLAVSKAISAS